MEISCDSLTYEKILLLITLIVAAQIGGEAASRRTGDSPDDEARRTLATETADAYDPCLKSRHIEINEQRRSILVLAPNIFSIIDDSNIPHFWYRFTSGAGGTIPTTCPRMGKCGTRSPIYMVPNNEMYIAPDDGSPHERQVCSVLFSNCRYRCFNIQVKNCTDFLVYNLPPSPPNAAYCAGDKGPCLEGETSITGFTPCTRDSNVALKPKPPSIELIEDDEESFYLECVLKEADITMQHDVQWMADGNLFLRQTIPPGQTRARLHESQMQYRNRTIIGYHISCAVSARKVGVNIGSRFTSIAGRGFFLGFKFVNADGHELREVVLDEDDPAPTYLYVKLTAPVRCNSPSYDKLPSFLRPPCKIAVKVVNADLEEIHDQMMSECSREQIITQKELAGQLTFGECSISFTKDNWKDHTQHRIPIFASQDGVYDGIQSRYVNLQVQANFQRVWDKYVPPFIKVTVRDTVIPNSGLRTCTSYNDPHITTFDGLEYENMKLGEFVLYEHPAHNFRVHAFFIKCNGQQASCNCGVAAQAGDDVILFDRCNKLGDVVFGDLPLEAREKGFLRQKVLVRGTLTPGFSLEHQVGTNVYRIKFPHGAELYITVLGEGTENINLKMIPSQADYALSGEPQKVRGLCGTFSKDRRDDLLLPDGSTYVMQDSDRLNGRFFPNTFSESWRIPEESQKSLYNGEIYYNNDFYGHKKCMCLSSGGEDAVSCVFQPQCDEYQYQDTTELVRQRTVNRRRRALDHDHVRDEYNFRFDPASQETHRPEEHWGPPGMEKRQAREYCTRLITSAPFYQKCRDLLGIDLSTDIETCVYDIGLIGSSSYAESMLERAKSKCEEKATSDLETWSTERITTKRIPTRIATHAARKLNVPGVLDGVAIDEFLGRKYAGRILVGGGDTTNENSEETLQPNSQLINSLCPQACSGRGRCISGRCQCDAGWTGRSCSFRSTAPTIYSIPLGGLCDKSTRPCRTTPVVGNNFIQSDKLKCIFISLETSEKVMTCPEVESYMEIHCPVPEVENYTRFKLKVSNDYLDANMNSAEVMFTVYRSDCVSCTSDACTILPQGCA